MSVAITAAITVILGSGVAATANAAQSQASFEVLMATGVTPVSAEQGDVDIAVRCGDQYNDRDATGWRPRAKTLSNIRSGPSTACPIFGVLRTSDPVDYHCFKPGQRGNWTYLRNVRTGVTGWVKDSNLKDNGSLQVCR
ncbi:SH3 domain-containing protein [Kibdelosporangium philippinense]|uniref:SH3 domain-containing protein n=2 Tax=Kibdelosporangium philippinense TaxID=211113 RepID=A0ABS8Z2H1_9PSEU|nr:SH3 domain-containing protein [Kibdelosporangium philippinense]MCE7002138.1 SH3 domain-containing protein [Kibdelosporangium philippinense]